MLPANFFRLAIGVAVVGMAGSLPLHSQSTSGSRSGAQPVMMASMKPALIWQRTSPPRGQMEGPVLYQLLFSASGTPGTLAKFDTNPRHLANSLITDNGSSVAIGGMSVNSAGVISFAAGQSGSALTSLNATNLSS